MAQDTVSYGRRAYYFVLAPNEVGETGSHQRGEIYVGTSQIGDLFPDLSADGERTSDHPIPVFHAGLGEWALITLTRFGRRYQPEVRLRRFPPHWLEGLVSGDIVVIVEAGRMGVLFAGSSPAQFPAGIRGPLQRALEAGTRKGVLPLPVVC